MLIIHYLVIYLLKLIHINMYSYYLHILFRIIQKILLNIFNKSLLLFSYASWMPSIHLIFSLYSIFVTLLHMRCIQNLHVFAFYLAHCSFLDIQLKHSRTVIRHSRSTDVTVLGYSWSFVTTAFWRFKPLVQFSRYLIDEHFFIPFLLP